jgi:hypothetical protein
VIRGIDAPAAVKNDGDEPGAFAPLVHPLLQEGVQRRLQDGDDVLLG